MEYKIGRLPKLKNPNPQGFFSLENLWKALLASFFLVWTMQERNQGAVSTSDLYILYIYKRNDTGSKRRRKKNNYSRNEIQTWMDVEKSRRTAKKKKKGTRVLLKKKGRKVLFSSFYPPPEIKKKKKKNRRSMGDRSKLMGFS